MSRQPASSGAPAAGRRTGPRLALGLWLVVVWVALWGRLSPAEVLGGAVAASALILLFPPAPPSAARRLRPLAAIRFVLFFSWKLVEASAIVAWEVVTPRNSINEGIVAVPIQGVSDGVITIVANAISLTPGTLTIEVDRDPTVLYVHVLHLRDIEAVRREVQHLELLAIRAFGGHPVAGDAAPADGRSVRDEEHPS